MIHRTIRFILLVVFIAVNPLWSFAQSINTPDVKNFTDNYFSTKLDEYHVPGAVFIMVKDGKVIYSQGYGYADLEKKI
ncbi:MAG TPA: serine hydrolase, partial [Spirochaetota bacterium]|nr:serine hydrolase [Spirochaetota bacterium]